MQHNIIKGALRVQKWATPGMAININIYLANIYENIHRNALNRTSYGSGKVMFNLQSVGHYGAWAIFMAIMGPYSLAHMGA